MEAAKDLCPQKANLFANISFSACSVVQRTEELGENIVIQLCQRARNFLWYSLALDESTDLASIFHCNSYLYDFTYKKFWKEHFPRHYKNHLKISNWHFF